jgi:hypothetical protein
MNTGNNQKAAEQEKQDIENDPAVRARLRTLLELAIKIGRREGLIGNHIELISEGGSNVTNKGNIRNSMAATTREDQVGD